jgi:hypothetical protein
MQAAAAAAAAAGATRQRFVSVSSCTLVLVKRVKKLSSELSTWSAPRGGAGATRVAHTSAYVSIRQHTSAYVSIRQHTSVN